ncbi:MULTISPECIES: hypothetical protein [Pseudomonadota]|uniref:hypothetical protein n=1 Tax=Pseudomonadota TaxID=1224 RepID=UPI00262C2910|nr:MULTISPECIES: hypothetical protein [Pseudomonadota]
MGDGDVAIPLSWFLGVIATLGGTIGVMAREFFKVQNTRVEEARGDTEKVVTALNDNTSALNDLTGALTNGGP